MLVTGYLSRSFTYTRANLRKLLTTVVVPYLVFETLLALFRTAVGGEDMTTLYVDPHWPMWYLSVLFLWRLATPLLNRVPHPLALAVAVSLLGGVTSGDPLDVARALGLLPFFVIGLTVTREQLDRLAAPRVRVVAAGAAGDRLRGGGVRRPGGEQGVALLAGQLRRARRLVRRGCPAPGPHARGGRSCLRSARWRSCPGHSGGSRPSARRAWWSTCSTASS